MTTFGRPGVYVQENIVQQIITTQDRSDAVGGLIGKLSKGPVEPTLVSSWSEFTKIFGALDYALPTTVAAYLFFSNGGRDAYVRRVTGTGAATATVTLNDISTVPTLTVSASSPGTWGNDLAVEIKAGNTGRFSLIVYGEPSTAGTGAAWERSNILEQFSDLSMSPTDPRYVDSIVNTFSAYLTVGAATVGTIPVVDTLTSLSGGVVGSAPTKAQIAATFTDFDDIATPIIFNLPDVAYWAVGQRTDAVAAYSDLSTYCETRGDAFAIVDIPNGLTAAEAVTFSSDVADANAGTHAAGYYPWLTIPDSSRSVPGVTRAAAPGGAVLGQYQATDTSRGVFKAPAGYNTRLSVAVGLETKFKNSDLDTLNSANVPVNAIRVTPGAGIVIMGGRTFSNTSPNRYINMRRSLIYLKKELNDRSQFAVFENNDERLWNQITSALSNFLNIYWQQGGLRGATPNQAFYVKCDATTTSQADIVNGRVNIQIGVALEYPAEFIVITIGQITGSASVVQA